MREFIEKYKALLAVMFVYWGICFVMIFKDNNLLYAMLSWNIFLAILPLYFIKKAEMTMRQKNIGWSVLWLALWLFFFPNSVYMITDFIHISNDKFLTFIEGERYAADSEVVYHHEIVVWTKLLVIGIGFFFASLAGLESLYLFEKMISKKYSKVISTLGFFVVAMLTGIGVYIGRFLRFNSWDVLANPLQLLKEVADADLFALQFSIAFSVFVLLSYIIYGVFRKQTG